MISSPVALTFSRESRGWNRNDGIPRSIAATRSFDFGMLITHNRRLAPPRNSAEFLYSASISVTISRPGLPSLLISRLFFVPRCVPRVFRGLRILGLESRYNLENLLSRGAHSASISRPRGSTLLTDHYLFYTFTRHHVLFSERYNGDIERPPAKTSHA